MDMQSFVLVKLYSKWKSEINKQSLSSSPANVDTDKIVM